MTELSHLPPAPDPLTTHRVERPRIEVLTRRDRLRGTLVGVQVGGSIELNVNRPIRGGGVLTVFEDDQAPWPLDISGPALRMSDVDWYSDRLRVWWDVEGAPSWALGTFVLSAPAQTFYDGYRGMEVSMMDKLSVLEQDAVADTYSLEAGTVITDAVKALIASTNETNMAITDAEETVGAAGLVWSAGTSKLRIVNDLLSAINYFSLWVDGRGQYRAAPYVRPEARPIRWSFEEGQLAIHSPEWTREQDLFSVPNRFIGVTQGDGEEPALSSVFPASPEEEPDPQLPISYARRGRWIVQVEEGIEATSQAALDSIVRQRYYDVTSAVANLQVSHASLPLELNDTVRFTSQGYGPALATITGMTYTLEAGALVQGSWREVSTS